MKSKIPILAMILPSIIRVESVRTVQFGSLPSAIAGGPGGSFPRPDQAPPPLVSRGGGIAPLPEERVTVLLERSAKERRTRAVKAARIIFVPSEISFEPSRVGLRRL